MEQALLVEESALTLSPARELDATLDRLLAWITTRHYAGYEPYDLLNSPYLSGKWARETPLAYAFIQFGKRYGGSKLRKWMKVPPSRNPKALALMMLGLCDLIRARGGDFNAKAQLDFLKSELLRLRSPNETEYCWGYDWDFKSIRGSALPKFAPNSIATTFCGFAFLELAELTGDTEALDIASSTARFITSRLNRSLDTPQQLCFSYTPANQTRVYNSSALAGALLAHIGTITKNDEYHHLARRCMHYLADAQQGSGAWAYGEGRMQQWVDGFHTGYNLSALLTYCRFTGDHSFDSVVARGYQYYVQNFFREDGAPKYFNNAVYPIDIHSCTQAMLTFCDFWNEDASAPQRAVNMADWTIRNMALPDGSFCYQKHALWTNRTPYMRWGQAWTFRSLARLALQLKTRT